MNRDLERLHTEGIAELVLAEVDSTDKVRRENFKFGRDYTGPESVPLGMDLALVDSFGWQLIGRVMATASTQSDVPTWLLTSINRPWGRNWNDGFAMFRLAATDVGRATQELARAKKITEAAERHITTELGKRSGRIELDREQNEAFLASFDAKFVGRDALDAIPDPKPLIEGMLDAASFGLLVGQSGTFKSFLALDWACSVVTGTSWLGHEVAPGRAVYCAGEGVLGIKKRIHAWESHHGVRAEDITVFTEAFDIGLEDGAAFTAFIERMAFDPPKLIVFDTLNRYAEGHDESKAQDMSVVNGNVAKLIAATGAHVLVVHHTTKAGDKTGRGSGALFAAADQAWAITRDGTETQIVLETTKSKNDAPPKDRPLGLEAVGGSLVIVAGDAILAFDQQAAADDEALLAALVTNPGLAQSRYYDPPSKKNTGADVRPRGIRNAPRIRAARDRLVDQGRAHLVVTPNGKELHPGPDAAKQGPSETTAEASE